MSHEIWTGRMAEEDMFGKVSPEGRMSMEEFKDLERLRKEVKKPVYPIEQLISNIKDKQPQNPNIPSSTTNPLKPFARALRQELVNRLYNNDPRRNESLRFYTTINSYLDYKGVDGVLVMDDLETGKKKLSLVDLTKNEEKIDGDKSVKSWANVVILIPEDLDLEEDSESFQSFVQDSASLIEGSFQEIQYFNKEHGERNGK